MASFAGINFLETPQGEGYPAHGVADLFAIKDRPNESPAFQEIGADLQRATIGILVTGAELLALYDQCGESGSLIFDWETCDAFLAGVGETRRAGLEDVYESSLDLIRLSGSPLDARLTEAGDTRITEAGAIRIIE